MKQQHQLKNAMLIMALASAYPMQSFAAAGIAQFSAGDVTLRRGAAADPLTKGRNIESGDAIVTGPNGRAQVRFSDGGLVSLQPNSQFNIANYADRNDPKQDAFLVDLLRGGMRAVTGLIGKRNRENFKVTTTTATIGIRGSAFNLAYNPDGSLSVSTELDEIEVCTRAGCIGLTAGESALVVSPQEAPVRTSTRATLPTPEPRQDPEVVANQQGIVPTPTQPHQPINPRVLSGLAFASSSLKTTEQEIPSVVSDGDYAFDTRYYDQRNYPEGTLYIDADGKPQVYLTPDVTGQRTTTATTTVVSETGTMAGGDFMMLGTWTENTWTAGSDVVDVKSTAFVSGLATPTTALAALTGQRGDYAFVAGTPVMSSEGITGELLSNSKLTVDFLGAGNYIDVNLNVRMPGAATPPDMGDGYYLQPLAEDGTTDYNLRGSGTASGANFGGKLSVSSAACVAGQQCGTGSFNGFLGGNNAEKAGVTFAANTYYHGYITGGGVFSRAGAPLTATPMDVVFEASRMEAAFMDGSDYFYAYSSLGDNTSNNALFTFNGDQLVRFEKPGYPSSTSLERATEPGTFGAIGKVTESDFIGWGTWVTANKTAPTGYGYSSSSTMLDSLHYIVGKPTPQNQMPQYGYANYALVGGTAPTATYNGVSQLGQLLGGSMSVNFGDASLNVNIQTKFGANSVDIYGSATFDGSGTNVARFRGDNCGTSINGIFTGNMAYRAGLVYGTYDSQVGRVTGAAAFQRTSSSGLATGPVLVP